jgi:hypothetical protein
MPVSCTVARGPAAEETPTRKPHSCAWKLPVRGGGSVSGHRLIWYGSPQDQIQAFRSFQISPALRERHGYAEITPQLRAKIFGLSAAKAYGLSAADVCFVRL